MSMSTKNSSRVSSAVKTVEDGENGSKPLAATILQEFQNLKDKFKNEDEGYEKGYQLSCLVSNVHVNANV